MKQNRVWRGEGQGKDPGLGYAFLVGWDHSHSDNSVGAQGADLSMETSTEDQHVFRQQPSHSKGGRPLESQCHTAGWRRGDGGRAGITDTTMFLPYMARRGRLKPTNDTG